MNTKSLVLWIAVKTATTFLVLLTIKILCRG